MATTLTTSTGPLNVLRAVVHEPLEGAWTARIEADADETTSGAVVLSADNGATWVGTIRRGAFEHGRLVLQVVGGMGGLGTELEPQAYDTAGLSEVLADIMTATGEVISPDTDTSVLTAQVARWSRPKGPAGLSIKQVCDESSADHWRVLRDGTVWLGAETWTAVPASFEHTEISRDPSQGTITIAPEDGAALVAPGQSFLGSNVAAVTTTITPGSLRQTIHWQDASGTVADRMLGPFRRLVESMVGRRIDYAQMYPSTVATQNGDGTLDLTPDDPRMSGDGYRRVQITVGIPGVSVTVPSGVRVNLYFLNGDPKQPRAALWPDGSSVSTITFGDGSESFMRTDTFLVALNTLVTAINAYANGGANPGKAALVAACGAFLGAPLQLSFKSTTILGE